MDRCGVFLDCDFGPRPLLSSEFFCVRRLFFDFAGSFADSLCSREISNFPESNLSKSSSCKMVTPRERALSCLEPGSAPTTT